MHDGTLKLIIHKLHTNMLLYKMYTTESKCTFWRSHFPFLFLVYFSFIFVSSLVDTTYVCVHLYNINIGHFLEMLKTLRSNRLS